MRVMVEIETIEHRAVIKFFVKGLMPSEIHSRIVKVFGESSPSVSIVKEWAAEFKRGLESVQDDPREGRPKSATKPEIIENMHDIILEDGLTEVVIKRENGTLDPKEEEGCFDRPNAYDLQNGSERESNDGSEQSDFIVSNEAWLKVEEGAEHDYYEEKEEISERGQDEDGSERESNRVVERNDVVIPNEAWLKLEEGAEHDCYEEKDKVSERGQDEDDDDAGVPERRYDNAAYSSGTEGRQLTYELLAVYPPRGDPSASDGDDGDYSPTEQEIVSEEDSDYIATHAKGRRSSGGRSSVTEGRKKRSRGKERPVASETTRSAAAERIGGPFQCDVCEGMAFEDGKSLRKHKKSHDEQTFDCDVCGKTFRFASQLANHRRVHNTEKAFECQVCRKGFTQFHYLKMHSRTHDEEKPFRCDICQQSFSRKTYLKTHVEIHAGHKPYHCERCDKSFTQKSNLVHHLRIHEGIKPFACDSCPARFTQKANLVHHRNKHLGRRPFKCQQCDRGFYQKAHLLDHVKTHTNQRPYKCAICGKSFAIKSNFNNHSKVHTGERPFKCDVCQRTFSQRSNFNKHKKTHGFGTNELNNANQPERQENG